MSIKKEQLKEKIQNCINAKGNPDAACYFDDCCVGFFYLDGDFPVTFEYWEDDILVGEDLLVEKWKKLFEEMGLKISVFPVEFLEEDEDYAWYFED